VDFYLGTHRPNWLADMSIPLFVARQSLAPRKTLPRARGPWALDSGAFSEITLRGGWTVEPRQYAAEVRRFGGEIGGMQWAAVQDWMCEPFALKRTGLTISDHQRKTVESYLELREIAPEQPWAPVLQGWQPSDYLRHVERYDRAGVDLRVIPVVGLGSVCRRSQTGQIVNLIYRLSDLGIRLHGFGVKTEGLREVAHRLTSADSMAWSFQARRAKARVPGCTTHQNCANCPRYALLWRARVLAAIRQAAEPAARQLELMEAV
jgi:hypothetical protein